MRSLAGAGLVWEAGIFCWSFGGCFGFGGEAGVRCGDWLFLLGLFGLLRFRGLGGFLDDEGIVGVEEDVALLEEPEKVGGVFGGRCGGTFREDGFPEAFEFGGWVLADPFHHFRRARGEHGIGGEGVGAGGAGEEFAFALEDGHVLGFEDFADQRDEDGGVLAVMVSGALQACKQAGGEVFAGNCGGDLGFAGDVVGFFQNLGDECALEFRAIGEPFDLRTGGRFRGGGGFFFYDRFRFFGGFGGSFRGFGGGFGFLFLGLMGRMGLIGRIFGQARRHGGAFLVGEDAPAGLHFLGLQPCVDGLFAALGADFRDIGFERHVGKALAVDAADFRLVGVEIRWPEPFAGDAAAGDGLEVALGRIDLDGGFLDEAVAPRGFEEVAEGFLLGEENGFLQLATVEGILFPGDFENGAAARALGEDDLRDIEERIDAGDVLDFLGDELDRGFLGDEFHGDAFGRCDLLALEVRAAAASPIGITASAASASALGATAVIAPAAVVAVATAASVAGIVPAVASLARLEFTLCGVLEFLLDRLGLGPRP